MSRNRIYINARFLTQEITGVQRVGLEISKYFQAVYGEDVIFLCPSNDNIIGKYPDLNIKRIGFFSGYIWEQIELPIYLLIRRAKVLVNFCNTAPILFTKNIVVIHDMAIKHNKNWFSWKFIFIYKILFYFNIKKAKMIITDSYFSKNEILKYYPSTISSKIKVIYLASFINVNKKDNIRGNYFLAVNSISPRKNIKVIIDAFKILDSNDYVVKVVGGTNNKVFGKETIRNNSNIQFLGKVDDDEMIELIMKSNALINSSLYEGFGLPPLEAMSLAKPCIISRIPVHEELYKDVAIFFNPNDSIELSEKIKNLSLDQNYQTICDKSYKLSQKFSWKKTAFEYIETVNNYLKTA